MLRRSTTVAGQAARPAARTRRDRGRGLPPHRRQRSGQSLHGRGPTAAVRVLQGERASAAPPKSCRPALSSAMRHRPGYRCTPQRCHRYRPYRSGSGSGCAAAPTTPAPPRRARRRASANPENVGGSSGCYGDDGQAPQAQASPPARDGLSGPRVDRALHQRTSARRSAAADRQSYQGNDAAFVVRKGTCVTASNEYKPANCVAVC